MQAILRQLRNSRSQSSAPLLFFLVFLSLTALICQTSPLCAGTIYQFNAKGYTEGSPDFALRYYDADGDNLFSLNELIPGTFTGVTIGSLHYTVIAAVPINSSFSPLTDGTMPNAWIFSRGSVGSEVVSGDFYWTYSQTIVASAKEEAWKLILDGDKGSGNCTLMKAENGTVTADGDWSYNYQGANVSGTYSGASVTIAGLSISITASGTANNPSAPPGYQTSPFTLSISGKAYNAHGSGNFTLTFTTFGWPPSISGTWKGTRSSGSGITRVIGIPSTLLLND